MRIAEVAVISPPGKIKEIFVQSICQKLEKADEKFCFGRLEINNDLVLHLYGISVEQDESNFSWDLLSNKLLGYVFIFNWGDPASLKALNNMLNFFSTSFSAPIMVIANVDHESDIPVPEKFLEPDGITIDRDIRFTFCNISNPQYSKKVIANIIDILVEKLA